MAVLLAVGIQTVAYQTFHIPSGSMKPNLLIGDFIFVSKFAYGYTHYSIPFSPPLFKGRLFGAEPKRGDVVVFRAPHKHNSEDWIKRCVGLPGDKIQMRGGVLFINGQECSLKKLSDDFKDTLYIKYEGGGIETRVHDKQGVPIERYIQTLPNGVEHILIKEKPFGEGRLDNTPELTVPEGHYFMMGDNRDGSDDSRNQEALGFVPYENLIGRADLIFFSTSARLWEVWNWLTGIRFSRLFNVIR
jgi:signal peptidase I